MIDLFTLKKLISFFLMPLNIIVLLFIIGFILSVKKSRFAKYGYVSGAVFLVLASLPIVSNSLMAPLEKQFSAYQKTDPASQVNFIIVLGCYHYSDRALPATMQLKTCSLQRLVEAVRISILHPEAQIITSGAGFNNPESNADIMKQAAISLGVAESKLQSYGVAKDTEEEAKYLAEIVKKQPSILVTNADHMRRALNYFTAQGVNVTPAPASFWVKGEHDSTFGLFKPNVGSLEKFTRAWYEYLGLIVQWLKQR